MIDVVVVYDRVSTTLLQQEVFPDDPTAAYAMRLERERAYRERPDVEVVLLNAETFEDLKRSHARYFDPASIFAERVLQLSEPFLKLAS